MKIRTIARAALIRLAILLGILVGLTLFINLPWFDEELHEDLVQLTPRDVPLEGNAYPLVLGFLAAESEDPREAGLQVIQAQREHYREKGHTTMPLDEAGGLRNPIPAPSRDQIFKGLTCAPRTDLDCADRMIQAVAAAPLDDARARMLLARFERILAESRYEETQEFDFHMLPNYGPLLTISNLRLAESFQEADSSRVLRVISDDSRLWKRMLEGDQTLVAKMVALAGLRSDTMFLSALMRTRQMGEDELRQMPTLLAPLTEGERNIEETFMAELRIARSNETGTGVLCSENALLRLVCQDNATANEYYLNLMLPLRLRASLSAAEFYRQKGYEPWRYPMRWMPSPLYNLGGKQYLKIMLELNNWQDYIARVHDVDGRIGLVLLQAEIALNAGQSVGEVVKASRYRNPYTGEPMDYDAGAGTIGFPCLGRGEEICALKIR